MAASDPAFDFETGNIILEYIHLLRVRNCPITVKLIIPAPVALLGNRFLNWTLGVVFHVLG